MANRLPERYGTCRSLDSNQEGFNLFEPYEKTLIIFKGYSWRESSEVARKNLGVNGVCGGRLLTGMSGCFVKQNLDYIVSNPGAGQAAGDVVDTNRLIQAQGSSCRMRALLES